MHLPINLRPRLPVAYRVDNDSKLQKNWLECVGLARDICTVTYYKNCTLKSLKGARWINYLSWVQKQRQNEVMVMVPFTTTKKERSINIHYAGYGVHLHQRLRRKRARKKK